MSTPLNRREFLKVSFATFAALSFARFGIDIAIPQGRAKAQSFNATFPNGVASGDVTQRSAVLWARHITAGTTLRFDVVTADDPATVIASATGTVEAALKPVKVSITDLAPNTDYFFRVMDDTDMLMGQFRTAAAAGTKRGLRFGAAGDWRGELAPYTVIRNAAERELEFFIGLGDTIYADIISPAIESAQAETIEEFRLKHNEVYGPRFDINYWADLRAVTPFIPTIDDHEVTNDFAGGAAPSTDRRFDQQGTFLNETKLYQNGMQAFFEYNPIEDTVWDVEDPRMAGKPKIYRAFRYGDDAALMVLDNRGFREQPLEEPTDFTALGDILAYLNDAVSLERTMLGHAQREALLNDLQAAHDAGVTWKFIITPEPIQNLGPVGSSDRFEGYAFERAQILSYIAENNITNVVFIAADIHGTVVNNVVYRTNPLGDDIATGAFEISTGSVAFYEPFGQVVISLGQAVGIVDADTAAAYRAADIAGREAIMEGLLNAQIVPLGYPAIGLDDAEEIDAELLKGRWLQTSTFGWSEFEIDADTQALTITTYGMEPYSPADAAEGAHLDTEPVILQQFVVRPRA